MPAIEQGLAPGAGFIQRAVPGARGAVLQTLQRAERTAPLRYRVIVIPGSGCAGMGPIADRYFAGLLHAQVLVLHKPGVDPGARTAPADCPHSFVSLDRHSTWLAHARAALRADALLRQGQPALPQLLVGISEGAELLPALAPEVPQLAGLVLIGSSGLDPQEAGALQARRMGVQGDWAALGQIVTGAPHDSVVVQGRSLGYWRDLWNWPLTLPLLRGPWPLLQVWAATMRWCPPWPTHVLRSWPPCAPRPTVRGASTVPTTACSVPPQGWTACSRCGPGPSNGPVNRPPGYVRRC